MTSRADFFNLLEFSSGDKILDRHIRALLPA